MRSTDASTLAGRDVARPRVTLDELARHLGAALSGRGDVEVLDVEQDSRKVGPGTLFAALRGARSDGLLHAPVALERGAVGVLCESGRRREIASLGAPVLEVAALRPALARAAAMVHGEPTQHLAVVGITGTNGKTTTAHLVEAALAATGQACGVLGTLGHRIGDEPLGEGHTSPEADELQRLAALVRDRGARHLVMEVSSIALAASRMEGVRFDVAAFTNLTQDHLDFHGTMDAYAAAKDKLFLDFAPRVSVVNVDDPHGATLAQRLGERGATVLSVSVRPDSAADVRPSTLSISTEGIAIDFADGGALRSPLVGAHNASNLLVGVAIARALGLDARALVGLGGMRTVAGRLERCDDPARDDLVAVVDYAHTPDALVRVLESVRGLTKGKLICVFGCGGDRDPAKRAPMGEAVARAADLAIVTNDNPRSEAPDAIAAEILVGLERGGARGRTTVLLDRAQAIRHAVECAAPGDVVLVAGKGHEPYQLIGAETFAFDDRVELGRALAARRERRGI
ncbi:MAG: UDP-N-acetylmuramoyl-L-alanyl-D-glutamate--2,6-diaminopimelate ligase [Deltaproteobacteria bacterium]|nr:UDP-N-acetylmuramoyl-L-alanyl-D-glutamate--2,6-diaminopimelate ligase [Deltaproteobacteria bacterium]